MSKDICKEFKSLMRENAAAGLLDGYLNHGSKD
jgi:hypothetical protein